jgi:hypothetical protein
MNPIGQRKCIISGCNNFLKTGATKYCSIRCCHVAQKKARILFMSGGGRYAAARFSRYCSIACAHGHRYRCKADAFFAQGGVHGYVSPQFLARAVKDYYGDCCLRCGWSERNPKTGKVPIEVEHIDGNWENSRLTNLTLLCPNCHALTPTFRALNRGRGRAYRLAGEIHSEDGSSRKPPSAPGLQEVPSAPARQLELTLPT